MSNYSDSDRVACVLCSKFTDIKFFNIGDGRIICKPCSSMLLLL